MVVKFVAYIDESGDTGLAKLKTSGGNGATEWFVLSCFLVRIEKDARTAAWVSEILSHFRNHQKPDLHYAGLLDVKKHIACEILARKQCALFVVLSNKKNVEGYRNLKLDGQNKDWTYWFLSRLLLERVTQFCADHVPIERSGEDKVRIIFSRRGGLQYADFARYLRKLRLRSEQGRLTLDQGDLRWSVVDDDEMFVLRHEQNAGLQLADLVAGAFFQALEQNRPAPCNPTFAKLLKPRMAVGPSSHVLGHGIKTIPTPDKMNLDLAQREIFEFYGYNPEGWQPLDA